MKTKIAILFIVAAFFLKSAKATTYQAAGVSTAQVQAAVDLATHGDTVTIPNGSATWTAGISTTKRIMIRALNYTATPAGMAGSGATSRNVTIVNNSGSTLFDFTTGNDFNCGLAGIAFTDGSGTGSDVVIHGSGTKVGLVNDLYIVSRSRYFDGGSPSYQPIRWLAQGGVFWNCVLDSSSQSNPTGGVGNDVASGCLLMQHPRAWATASTMGMLDSTGLINFYVEDCTFKATGAPDIDVNTRVAFRYCKFDGVTLVTHGFTSSDGGRHVEIYNSRFDNTLDERNIGARYYWMRAGTALFTDNVVNNATFPGDYGAPQMLQIGESHFSPSQLGSYPIPEQPGWGHNGSANVIDPIYIWNCSGSQAYLYGFQNGWDSVVLLNRELFVNNGAKPGYVKFTYPHPARTGTAPPPDTTPPIISSTNVSSITASGFIVNWQTSEPTTNALDYGTSLSYGTTLTQSEAASFGQAVTSLSASTLYYLRIRSGDAAGNKATNTLSATTAAVDSTAPIISGTNIINISSNSATMLATVNESSMSGVTWGYTTATSTGTATNGANFSLSPSVSFSGATPGTLVYVRFWVSDASGNTNSVLASFTTGVVNPPATAKIYYVDQTAGNDNNSGLVNFPWKNCPGMKGASAYTGGAILNPGDTVYFDRGDTWLVSSVTLSQSAFTLVGGVSYIGDVWGTGTRAKIWANGNCEAGIVRLATDDASIETRLQGFDISGQQSAPGVGYSGTGIDVNHGFYTVGMTRAQKIITNNYVHHCYGDSANGNYRYGIIVSDHSPDASAWVANVTIVNNIVDTVPRDGILCYPGDFGMVSNVVVRGNYVTGAQTDTNYFEGAGITAKGMVKNCTFEYNTVSNMNSSAVFVNGPEAGGGNGPTNLTIRYNILQTYDNNGTLRFYGTGIIKADVYGNIFLTNSTTGALNADGMTGTLTVNAYNNTFVNTFVAIGNPTTATIYFSNNIIWAPGMTPLTDSNTKITSHSNNVYYRTGSGTALAVRGGATYTSSDITSYEASALSSNPLFVNTANLPVGFVNGIPFPAGLDLQAGSPSIDSGGTISGGNGLGINGYSRPQGLAWDRGAYETPSTADTTPPTLLSARIASDGITWRFQYSEGIGFGSGGSGGHAVTMTGGACTLTYSVGAGTSIYYTGSRTIDINETGTAAYTQPGNGIEDAAGNDVVSWSNATVINESTQGTSTNRVAQPPKNVRVIPGS